MDMEFLSWSSHAGGGFSYTRSTQQLIVTPPTLIRAKTLGDGVFQFPFSNDQGAAFTVLSTTNLSLPLTNWTVFGAPFNSAPGLFQFTTQPLTNESATFFPRPFALAREEPVGWEESVWSWEQSVAWSPWGQI